MKREMKKLLLLLLVLVPTVLSAQKMYYFSQLQVNRTDDGRVQYIDKETNKPLKGDCKVMENYRRNDTYYLTKYKNGFKDGKDVGYKNGRIEVECAYKEGRREGKLTEYWPGGTEIKREAIFKNGLLEGKDLYYYVDGSTMEEIDYRNGVQHGKQLAYSWQGSKNGRELTKEFLYVNGKLDGKQMSRAYDTNTSGYTTISEYKDGVLIEEKEYYFPGGSIRKIKEGNKVITYNEGGSLESEMFYNDNGRLDGEQKKYYDNGQVERISTYVNGQKEGIQKEFYSDGQNKLEETYKNGSRAGISIQYYPNGQKKSEFTYDSYRSGPFKIYYDNGKIHEEGEADGNNYVYRKIYYKNGQLKSYWIDSDGVWTEVESYDEDGKQQ